MIDDELSERLSVSVPDAPDVTGWGQASRERHRRSRQVRSLASVTASAAIVVASIVVASVLAFPLLAGGDHGRYPSATPPAGSSRSVSGSCLLPHSTPPAPDGKISPGAVAVGMRECRETNGTFTPLPRPDINSTGKRPTGGSAFPLDELTENIDDVIDAANEPTPGMRACPADAGPTYQIYFRYPDGHQEATTYEDFGCRDGADALAAFANALLAQRNSRKPPARVPAPTCAGIGIETILPIPPPLDLAAATICRNTPDGEVMKPLDAELLAQVPVDPPVTYVPSENLYLCPKEPVTLLATTVWGDAVMLSGQCGAFQLPHIPNDDRQREPVWRPTGDLAKALNP